MKTIKIMTKTVKCLITCVLLVIFTNSNAQKVGKVETKNSTSYGMKKFNKAPKKIFIQDFFINYQLLYDQIEISRGGQKIGGGYKGKAKAQLVLGLLGITENALQEITDNLYKEYVERLEAKGFEIVSASEVKNNKFFEGWKMFDGGTPSKSQFLGYVSTAPTGFKFLIRKVSKSGKMKKKSVFDNGLGASKDLGGIIIARVNIAVPFVQEAESQGSKAITKTFGGVAKAVAKTELSVTPYTTVTTQGKVIGEKVESLTTSSFFVFKESMKNQATLNVIPKKKILIDGVLESKKYKAVQSAGQDMQGTDIGAIRVFSVEDRVLTNMQNVECKSDTYKKGVLEANKRYLNKSLDEFLKYIK